MTTDRIDELWSRYLAGEPLQPEEEMELLEALASDDSLRQELLEDEQMDGLLRGTGRSQADVDEFVGVLQGRLGGTRRRSKRLGTRRSEPTSVSILPWAVAAGMLIALVGLFVVSTRTPPRSKTERPREIVRKVEPAPVPVPETKPEPVIEPEPRIEPTPEPSPEPVPEIRPPAPVPPKNEPVEEPEIVPEPPPPEPVEKKTIPVPEETRVTLAVLETIEGRVQLLQGRRRKAAKAGSTLEPGQKVRTRAKGSKAVIRYPDSTVVELRPDTVVSVQPDGSTHLSVEEGAVFVKTGKGIVRTPHAEVQPHKAEMEVQVDRSRSQVHVSRGWVRALPSEGGVAIDLTPGQHAVYDDSGLKTVQPPLPRQQPNLLVWGQSSPSAFGRAGERVTTRVHYSGQVRLVASRYQGEGAPQYLWFEVMLGFPDTEFRWEDTGADLAIFQVGPAETVRDKKWPNVVHVKVVVRIPLPAEDVPHVMTVQMTRLNHNSLNRSLTVNEMLPADLDRHLKTHGLEHLR